MGTTTTVPLVSVSGLARAIETIETTASILRGLSQLSLRVGGQRAEASCNTAVEEAERRLTILRDLAARAQARQSVTVQVLPSEGESRTPLSPREWDVAQLVARGYTNQQIAVELVLTPGTVANHVAHILTKLNLQSRTQIAVWVIRQAGVT